MLAFKTVVAAPFRVRRKTMNKAQTVIEYFIITVVFLAVILSSGIIERFRNSFQGYFDAAVEQMK